ncbi:hypothetical protein BN14_11267 [Rhizoctonia solani AG-1 IB]|uniref:Chromo domain-containing protein n=1 Tax=Thanatephorus cucumeris (strain AG1-IB / isolate 7/3/14) TaxID=1108050 RepID=M5CCG1_THACB|nr:hypothetical protein BN14_11267 [Rhizoctonia solani AG-1 IB]
MPPAGATLLPSLQSSTNSPPAQVLWQAPAPATDNWQLFSYKGWSKEEIQRHRQSFDPDYRQEEEMLYSFKPTGSPAGDDRAKQFADRVQEVQASIKCAQERYQQADKGKAPPEFAPGDKVWLLASNITLQRPNKKLDHKQFVLPETMKIHDVFHVSLLTAYKFDTEFKCHFTLSPPVITTDGKEEYQVDQFVDWAAEDGIWKYRVRWKGYVPH